MAALQFTVYPVDVKILAEVDDPRALDLFRKGLDSPNPGVVAYSVEGLGRLHDMSALPLIEQVFQRLPSGDRMAVPMELPWYDRPEAYQLMQRLNPNPATLNFDIQQVERMRLAEAQAAQARAAKAKLR
jgi:HEAT repeat protein